MIGAIAGDIIGSVYENLRTKRKDFKLFTRVSTFTDDAVPTVAVADALLTDRDYGRAIKALPFCVDVAFCLLAGTGIWFLRAAAWESGKNG